MIYILLYKKPENEFISDLQKRIILFLNEFLVKNIDKSEYKIILCNKHIIENDLKIIDIKNDYVLWHPNLASDNLSLVKRFINSIVILKHKTVLIQKISKRNSINENMAINNNFKLMYIENDYNDVTNLNYKLVTQPQIININNLINDYGKINY